MFASVWVEGPLQPFMIPLPTKVSSSDGVAPNALYFPMSYRSVPTGFSPPVSPQSDILRWIQQTDKRLKYTEFLLYLRFIKHTRLDPKYFDDLHEIYLATQNGKIPLQAKVPKTLSSKMSSRNGNTKRSDSVPFDALPEIKDIIRSSKKCVSGSVPGSAEENANPNANNVNMHRKDDKDKTADDGDVESCGTKVDGTDDDGDDNSSDYSDSMEHVLDFLNFSSDDETDVIADTSESYLQTEGNVTRVCNKDDGNNVDHIETDDDDWETFLNKLVQANGANLSSTSVSTQRKIQTKTKVKSNPKVKPLQQRRSSHQYQSNHLQTKPLFNGGSSNMWSYNVISSDVDWSLDTQSYAQTSV